MGIVRAALLFLLVWGIIKIYKAIRQKPKSAGRADRDVRVKNEPGSSKKKHPKLEDAEYIDFEEVKD